MGFLEKLGFKKNTTLEKGVEESRNGLLNKLGKAIAGKDQIDDAILDELEEILITSDVGVKTTLDIIRRIEERVSREKYVTKEELNTLLRDEIIDRKRTRLNSSNAKTSYASVCLKKKI